MVLVVNRAWFVLRLCRYPLGPGSVFGGSVSWFFSRIVQRDASGPQCLDAGGGGAMAAALAEGVERGPAGDGQPPAGLESVEGVNEWP